MNYYEIPTQNKHYNPIVETMNNNYQNLYQNFDAENFYANNQNQTNSQNLNTQTNSQNQQNTDNQNMSDKTGPNNTSNMNNIANMLNSFGGNNNYMDMIKTIASGGNGVDKNQMILNLLSNINNKSTSQNKKTTSQNSDFLNLTSIEDYNFID